MRLKRRIFLLDVDNTLLNTEKLKLEISKQVIKKFRGEVSLTVFWDAYQKTIQEYGYNDIYKLSDLLAKSYRFLNKAQVTEMLLNLDFKKCLYKDALKLITGLKKDNKVLIYSLGHFSYQLIKIRKSGIERVAGKNNVKIIQNKKSGIKQTIKKLRLEGYKQIIIVDDRADVLESAHESDPEVFNFWLKNGKYKDIEPQSKYAIDYRSNRLSEVGLVTTNFVSKITTDPEGEPFQIWKGVTPLQIKQLLKHSKIDIKSKLFTHDSKRFKNISSFNSWNTGRKTLYSLTDLNQNLVGIIWFSKQNYKQCEYTFAIRTYPPVRGKHIAQKFMLEVFNHFKPKSVWLKTEDKNEVAVKLYKNFGFRQVSIKNGVLSMVYP